MKKRIVYAALLCSWALLAAISCDQDNEGKKHLPENEGLTFFATANELLAAPADTCIAYEIGRGNTKGRLEIPLVAGCDPAVFTLPSTVVFEDGAGTASINIPLKKTTLGVTYPITLAFDSVQASPFGYFKTSLTVMRDYKWLPSGVAEMYSGWAGNEEGIDVSVEQAEGSKPSRYRLVSPFYVIEPEFCPKPGSHFVFELNENHQALKFPDAQKIGELYEGKEVYFFSSEKGDTFTNEGNTFTVTGLFFLGDGRNFGRLSEVFIWKEGYPGKME
ncbi:MAG: hypothetical protein LBH61_02565 [Dysgonamonadaceae bacterium]|jgi:hypothetical protein|nr:hypothetical protein [Dysgonamonadaceae bacterium]